MSCSAAKGILYNYISAYVDDELSSTDRAAVEKHFEICAQCANERFEIEQMKNIIHYDFRYSSPYGLEEDIKIKIAESAEQVSTESNEEKTGFLANWLNYVMPPFISAVAAVLIVLALVPQDIPSPQIQREIVSAHIRSLMEDNLTHVEFSAAHQVKPWFNGRVDFVAKAKDLSQYGFNLKGGRMDYVNNQNTASIVYQYRKHIINLFIFPTTEQGAARAQALKNRDYNIVTWTSGGLEYFVISDLKIPELKKFTHLYIGQAPISNL